MSTESNCSETHISISELINKLNYYGCMRDATNFIIKEDFVKKGQVDYKLLNLTAEYEDDYIIFGDAEGILEESASYYYLRMFLASEILSVTYHTEEFVTVHQSTIKFKDGSIRISALID